MGPRLGAQALGELILSSWYACSELDECGIASCEFWSILRPVAANEKQMLATLLPRLKKGRRLWHSVCTIWNWRST